LADRVRTKRVARAAINELHFYEIFFI
jgi:hypothetical protein